MSSLLFFPFFLLYFPALMLRLSLWSLFFSFRQFLSSRSIRHRREREREGFFEEEAEVCRSILLWQEEEREREKNVVPSRCVLLARQWSCLSVSLVVGSDADQIVEKERKREREKKVRSSGSVLFVVVVCSVCRWKEVTKSEGLPWRRRRGRGREVNLLDLFCSLLVLVWEMFVCWRKSFCLFDVFEFEFEFSVQSSWFVDVEWRRCSFVGSASSLRGHSVRFSDQSVDDVLLTFDSCLSNQIFLFSLSSLFNLFDLVHSLFAVQS